MTNEERVASYIREHDPYLAELIECGVIQHTPADVDEWLAYINAFEALSSKDQATVCLLESHRPELLPFTAVEMHEWIDHVEACGGYEHTAFGSSLTEEEKEAGRARMRAQPGYNDEWPF